MRGFLTLVNDSNKCKPQVDHFFGVEFYKIHEVGTTVVEIYPSSYPFGVFDEIYEKYNTQ